MILVILGVSAIMAVVGCIFLRYFDDCGAVEFMGIGGIVVGVSAFIISAVVAICLTVDWAGADVLDERIAMYQEENSKIEKQIESVVSNYMEYESETFANVTVDSAITFASLYPELKSNTLVQTQIEVYVDNDRKILELKEAKITAGVTRWWLYFGK